MKVAFEKPEALTDAHFTFCPGCTHGVTIRLMAEVIDELDLRKKAVGIAPVGCSVFVYENFNCDMIQASHGRAPAVATGVKRTVPDAFVFAYQGDGDIIAIGTTEIVHAAARGENISIVFANNGVYGMTRGQIAPTTIPGQKTTTSPLGRDPALEGYPVRVCEMLATLDGPAYIARVTVTQPKYVRQAKRAIKKAFQAQVEGRGFSLVEVLSSCPGCWGLPPDEALKWAEENMMPYYPLGEFVGGDEGKDNG
ncbi:MAG: thiamine pyrophosphate-dependent enzyme [Armatimonadota bacterium]